MISEYQPDAPSKPYEGRRRAIDGYELATGGLAFLQPGAAANPGS